jgi:hypothetical protein
MGLGQWLAKLGPKSCYFSPLIPSHKLTTLPSSVHVYTTPDFTI